MCKWVKSGNQRIDPCMKLPVYLLDIMTQYKALACCCGHGKYPETIIAKDLVSGVILEFNSKTPIPRKKRFYKRDSEGVFFIPEFASLHAHETANPKP